MFLASFWKGKLGYFYCLRKAEVFQSSVMTSMAVHHREVLTLLFVTLSSRQCSDGKAGFRG